MKAETRRDFPEEVSPNFLLFKKKNKKKKKNVAMVSASSYVERFGFSAIRRSRSNRHRTFPMARLVPIQEDPSSGPERNLTGLNRLFENKHIPPLGRDG